MITLLNRTTHQILTTDQPQLFSPVEWVFDPDLTEVEGVPHYYWKLERNRIREMTEEEKLAYNQSTLPGLKAEKEKKLKVECRDAIYVRYPPDNQTSLVALMVVALAQQMPNRFQYIVQAVGFIDHALTYYYAKAQAIQDAQTVPELEAITWDMTSVWEKDPLVTIQHARTIMS